MIGGVRGSGEEWWVGSGEEWWVGGVVSGGVRVVG